LEYQIYRDTHPEPPGALATRHAPFVPPTTLQAVRTIINKAGPMGLYTGWRLHFVRDTSGTALYFAEYDVMRYWLGRKSKGKGREGETGEQGEVPEWARSWLPPQIIPFLCGSVAGVSSWALIYPVDVSARRAS
jgi:solute carrier family 25 carnitine/acylcarnitine transporter 20/29